MSRPACFDFAMDWMDADEAAQVRAYVERLERDRAALVEAAKREREQVLEDRTALFDCHVSPISGEVEDAPGKEGLAQYDAVLAELCAAIASAEKPIAKATGA